LHGFGILKFNFKNKTARLIRAVLFLKAVVLIRYA
jgi:hypothetical protein